MGVARLRKNACNVREQWQAKNDRRKSSSRHLWLLPSLPREAWWSLVGFGDVLRSKHEVSNYFRRNSLRKFPRFFGPNCRIFERRLNVGIDSRTVSRISLRCVFNGDVFCLFFIFLQKEIIEKLRRCVYTPLLSKCSHELVTGKLAAKLYFITSTHCKI